MTDQLTLPKLTDKRRAALAELGVTSAESLLHLAATDIADAVNGKNDRTRTTAEVVERWLLRAAEVVVGEGPERLDPAMLAGWELYATFGVYFQRREAADSTSLEHRVVVNHVESDAERFLVGTDCSGVGELMQALLDQEDEPPPASPTGGREAADRGLLPSAATRSDSPPQEATDVTNDATGDIDPGNVDPDGVDTVEIVAVRAMVGGRELDLTSRPPGRCPQVPTDWELEVELAGPSGDVSAELLLNRVDSGATTAVTAVGHSPVLRSASVHTGAGYHHALLSLRAADTRLLTTLPLGDILVTA